MKEYSLFRKSHMTQDMEWGFITAFQADNIILAESIAEAYIMPGFYYLLVRSS